MTPLWFNKLNMNVKTEKSYLLVYEDIKCTGSCANCFLFLLLKVLTHSLAFSQLLFFVIRYHDNAIPYLARIVLINNFPI